MKSPVLILKSPYKKPPIVEAVLAIHFSNPLEQKWIGRFAAKRKSPFYRIEDMSEISTAFNTQTQQTASNIKKVGQKISNADGNRLIFIMPAHLAIIHLAPYQNWETLCSDARMQWDVLVKITKWVKVSRVSARYVNRIDIPVEQNGNVDLHNYFNAGLSLPPVDQAMTLQEFHINSTLLHESGKFINILQVYNSPASLIDHISITIDIDILSNSVDITSDELMWNSIESLRSPKNDLFESCITDKTRKLFQ